MSDALPPDAQPEESRQTQSFTTGIVIGMVVLTIILVAVAVVLAIFADQTAPGVEVVRDLLIIILALEMFVIGAAVTVFLVQVARFINLINNEVQPIITSTQDTINAVRGTAIFLSKNLAEPVIAASSTLSGIGKAARDFDGIRKAAGIAMAVASSASPTATRSAATGNETGSEDNIVSEPPVKQPENKPVKDTNKGPAAGPTAKAQKNS